VPALAHFLHHNQQLTNLQMETLRIRQELGVITESERQLRDERQKFQDFLELFESKVYQEAEYIDILAGLQYSLPEVQKRVSSLQEENEAIRQLVKLAKELPPVKHAADLDDELKRSKGEIIILQTALSEAEGNVMALKAKTLSGELSEGQLGVVFSLAQELRKSAASISKYVRFLLGESLGELDGAQRKLLRSVQGAAGRMENLALDLIDTLSKDNGDQEYDDTGKLPGSESDKTATVDNNARDA
jgi:signal transduction histidine kinase